MQKIEAIFVIFLFYFIKKGKEYGTYNNKVRWIWVEYIHFKTFFSVENALQILDIFFLPIPSFLREKVGL